MDANQHFGLVEVRETGQIRHRLAREPKFSADPDQQNIHVQSTANHRGAPRRGTPGQHPIEILNGAIDKHTWQIDPRSGGDKR